MYADGAGILTSETISSGPKVAVVMAVRNASRTVREAVESILAQTLPPAEFVIVDDASEDDTAAIISSYCSYSVRLIRNAAHLGVAQSMNRAIAETASEYIAVMHGDDVSAAKRLATQSHYLTLHPEVAVVGSWVRIIDAEGRITGRLNLPTKPGQVAGYAVLSVPFRHPSVMMRRSVLAEFPGPYRDSIIEDYELWSRLLVSVRGGNIDQVLLDYRVHPNSLTSTNRAGQAIAHGDAAARFYAAVTGDSSVDPALFARLARAIVLTEKLSQADFHTLSRLLAVFNSALVKHMDNPAIGNDALAEQSYILSKIALRSGPLQLARLLFDLMTHSPFVLVRMIGAPLYRDVRRVLGMS